MNYREYELFSLDRVFASPRVQPGCSPQANGVNKFQKPLPSLCCHKILINGGGNLKLSEAHILQGRVWAIEYIFL